jgi:hypothetical protein
MIDRRPLLGPGADDRAKTPTLLRCPPSAAPRDTCLLRHGTTCAHAVRIMDKYKVPNLTPETSQPERTKLLTALKGVQGVASATLIPESSEFTVQARDKKEPKREEVEKAASKAGFAVSNET